MRHTDLVLVSSDSVPVLFYAHSRILQGVSKNSFARLLPACESTDLELDLPSVKVALDARVLNVVLHALYGFSSAHYAPEFSTLCTAVDALLTTYAVHQTLVLQQTSPLFALLMAHAPLQPLNVYALAAKHDIEPLAVASSSFLLSYPIDSITDDDARRMGPVYLRRLFFLHLGRVAALKRLLAPLPERHAPTPDCDTPDQDKVKRAWILATAFLIYDARSARRVSGVAHADAVPQGGHHAALAPGDAEPAAERAVVQGVPRRAHGAHPRARRRVVRRQGAPPTPPASSPHAHPAPQTTI